ncbi:MAG: mechanosensitive ion channel [Coprobacter sp.]|nr:mechanosensitive ion channel [Coprobacter sp.]
MKLLNLILDVTGTPADTTQVVPVEALVEKLSGMSGAEIISSLTSGLLSFGLKCVGALVIFFVGRWLMKRFTGFVSKVLNKRHVEPSIQSFLRSLINITLMITLIILIIGIFGVNTSSFVALFASAGVAVGMALSGSLQNFAGGVMILLFRPYKVGDYIEAQGQSGTVKEIQIFNTVLSTVDNRIIFIPNGNLSNNIITNYSHEDLRRVDWTFGIGYGDSYEDAKAVLADLLAIDKRVLRTPEPFIALNSLGESSVNIVVRVWVKSADYWDVYFDLNRDVYKTFAEKGISIPYPQMDVHIKQ